MNADAIGVSSGQEELSKGFPLREGGTTSSCSRTGDGEIPK